MHCQVFVAPWIRGVAHLASVTKAISVSCAVLPPALVELFDLCHFLLCDLHILSFEMSQGHDNGKQLQRCTKLLQKDSQ